MLRSRFAVVAALVGALVVTATAGTPAVGAVSRSAVVSGALIDAVSGAPLVGTKVNLFVGIEGGGLHTDRTDAEGKFKFVVSESKRFEHFRVDIEVVDGDKTTQHVDATIDHGRDVDLGVVKWQKNGSVTVTAGTVAKGLGQVYGANLIDSEGNSVASCYILDDSSCHMSYANPGRYAVRLLLDGGWSYAGNTPLFEKADRVTLRAGLNQPVVIDAKRSSGSISGTLATAGIPVGSTAKVIAQRVQGSELDYGVVYDRGKFVIPNMPPGRYTLSSALDTESPGVHLIVNSRFAATGRAKNIAVRTKERTHVGTIKLAARYFQAGWA